MRVGFTGTRKGLTAAQKEALYDLLEELLPTEARHGACVGADYHFAAVIADCHPQAKLIAHPQSQFPELVSGDALAFSDERLPPKPALDRNKDIVNGSDLLIACPETAAEQQRSGTWSTVRYARKLKRPIRIILPDGTVKEE